ncbi:MAG: GAF domain-containing sensor histidine kinase [Anaerolineae bacterium]|nr:GAF domain-containing sensor histidine kinase [Anaerolineae bacterium]
MAGPPTARDVLVTRTMRQVDIVAAWGRLASLFGVLIVSLAAFPLSPGSVLWPIAIATGVMVVVDVVPLVMLRFGFYPTPAALAFSILDSAYALTMVALGGGIMVFYGVVPVIALCARFDWAVGLASAGVLAAGSVLVALLQGPPGLVGATLLDALSHSLGLLLCALLGGFGIDALRREPPLGDEEAEALRTEVRQLEADVERSRVIYEMAAMLGATLDPERIMDAILELSVVGSDELSDENGTPFRQQTASAVFLFGERGLYVAASRNIPPPETRLTLRAEGGLLQRVLREGEPIILDSLSGDAELGRFTPFRRCRSALCVPLRAGFELYGLILFTSPMPDAFAEVHAQLLTAVASQAAVALNNAQLYQDLRQEKERILEVGDEERNKLARDLHDGPTQSISAIAMRLNFARLMVDRDPDKVKAELFKLENLARRTTKEIRTMLFAMRPVVLETQGLKAAVEQLVAKIQETRHLPVTLEIADGIEDQVDVSVQGVAWSVTQEALNNAQKYASADNIWIRMYTQDGAFVTEIEDDGVGFDYDETMASYDGRASYGLLNYQERAALVNGRCIVRTTLGRGTIVRLSVPLHQGAL